MNREREAVRPAGTPRAAGILCGVVGFAGALLLGWMAGGEAAGVILRAFLSALLAAAAGLVLAAVGLQVLSRDAGPRRIRSGKAVEEKEKE